MAIVTVTDTNRQIFLNLSQAYEAETSGLTHKLPNEEGVFPMDTQLEENVTAYLFYEETTPIGLAVVRLNKSGVHQVLEFYIVPSFRYRKLGCQFAGEILHKTPGAWQVEEIKGAESAVAFWRYVIRMHTHDKFKEDVIEHPYWGKVTRQRFSIA